MNKSKLLLALAALLAVASFSYLAVARTPVTTGKSVVSGTLPDFFGSAPTGKDSVPSTTDSGEDMMSGSGGTGSGISVLTMTAAGTDCWDLPRAPSESVEKNAEFRSFYMRFTTDISSSGGHSPGGILITPRIGMMVGETSARINDFAIISKVSPIYNPPAYYPGTSSYMGGDSGGSFMSCINWDGTTPGYWSAGSLNIRSYTPTFFIREADNLSGLTIVLDPLRDLNESNESDNSIICTSFTYNSEGANTYTAEAGLNNYGSGINSGPCFIRR